MWVINLIKKDILPSIDRWPGLVILTIAPLFLIYLFYPQIINDYKSYPTTTLVSVFLPALFVWLWLRRYPVFKTNEIGILLALTGTDIKTDEELIRLQKKIESIIISEKLGSKVVIKTVSHRLVPKTEESAHKLRDKMFAHLIIWGHVDRGKINSEDQTIFVPIFFSYKFNLTKQKLDILSKNFNGLLKQHRWIIGENNSVIDRDYLSKNIEHISFYIIGLVLFFAKEFNLAIEILGRVLKHYKSKPILSNDDKTAVTNTLIAIKEAYRPRIYKLELWPNAENINENINKAEKLVEELERLEFKADAEIIRAQIKFAKKDFEGTRKSLLESLKNSDNDDPAPFIGLTFLSYYLGELPDGLKYLHLAKERNLYKLGDQSMIIVRWYIEALKEDPQKTYLNFPLGMIYYLFDKSSGIEHLEKFCSDCKEDKRSIIKQMLYQSNKLLKKKN